MAKDQLKAALGIIEAVTSDLDYVLTVDDYEGEDAEDLVELHRKLDQLLGEFEGK